jgi:hypothetical protein
MAGRKAVTKSRKTSAKRRTVPSAPEIAIARKRRIAEWGQLAEGDPVRERWGNISRDLEGEARLPGTARAREDDQPDLVAAKKLS